MNLIRANCELLQQGADLLARHDDRTYSATDVSSYGSGIGAHFRHVLDHYNSFLEGTRTGTIDYDARIRNTDLETNREIAIGRMVELIASLEGARVNPSDLVSVKVSASLEDDDLLCQSSFGREMQFLVSHTVHHYALIAIASRILGIDPKEGFGVAPSTLKYLKTVHR